VYCKGCWGRKERSHGGDWAFERGEGSGIWTGTKESNCHARDGLVEVPVALNGQQYTNVINNTMDVVPILYYYYDSPFNSIYPLGGPVEGGTSVTIYGEEFLSMERSVGGSVEAFCQFGDQVVPVTNVSNTTATCTSPPNTGGQVGTIEIKFAVNGGHFIGVLNHRWVRCCFKSYQSWEQGILSIQQCQQW
jgi:hypothetical protein